MKKMLLLSCAALALFVSQGHAEELKIGYVNVKTCIEKSKHGNDEKVAFEALKKQMTETLEKSDKELADLAKKLEDQDYLDSLSPAAEEELKGRFENLSQEFVRYQNQYYQLLQQANYRMLSSLHESISKASEDVRAKQKLTFILNQDSAFAASSAYDLTEAIIQAMNANYEKQKGNTASLDPKAPKAS
jgi:outer membrane protein